MIEWAIDTWVLARADPRYEEALDAVGFLCVVFHKHRLALDHDGVIENEYQPYIRANEHVRKWWTKMTSVSGKISHRNGHLIARHRAYLVNAGRIGETDGTLASVAANASPSQNLVTQDGDFSQEVIAYLAESMGVTVYNLTDALALSA